MEDEWLRLAVERANAKAEVMAHALGVRILGILEASAETIGTEPQRLAMATQRAVGRALRRNCRNAQRRLSVLSDVCGYCR